MKYLTLIGRILFIGVFLSGAVNHLLNAAAMTGYAGMKGVPMPELMVPFTGLMLLGGSLSILLGYKAKLGAWLLIAFLVPVTFMMHDFWADTDPMVKMGNMVNFQKNVSLLGACFLIAHFGSGPFSLDHGI